MIKFLFSLLFLLAGCAIQIAPSGGEIDKVPPEIFSTIPQNNSLNYFNNFVEFEFSEYINKSTFRDAVFISPLLIKPFDIEWNGKSVRIVFNESLKKNTTYTITLGTSIADLNNNNKISEPFNFVFSTGDRIDNGVIEGEIYGNKKEGVIIGAYRVFNPDTLDPRKIKPDYISQSGIDGRFSFKGVSNSLYLLFAIQEEFNDYLYQIESDKLGIPDRLIEINDSINIVKNLKMQLFKEDTTSPRIAEVIMTDIKHILLKFTERIDSSKVNKHNFKIILKDSDSLFFPDYFFRGNASGNDYYIALNKFLLERNDYFLIAENICDLNSNCSVSDTMDLFVSERIDTISLGKPSILTSLPDGFIDFQKPEFKIYFNDAVISNAIKFPFSLFDKNSFEISTAISVINDSEFIIRANSDLKPDEIYKLKVDMSLLQDPSGNKTDTVYFYELKTINNIDFSGVSGEFLNNDENSKIILVLTGVDKKFSFQEECINNRFNFNRILPGRYLISYFEDRDSNGVYNYGSYLPFLPSEKFGYISDTLNLRARWPIGDIKLEWQ